MIFGKLSERLEAPFFSRHDGSLLERLYNYPGSLMEKFGRVTNIKKFKLTDLRKGLEGKIQASSHLLQNVKHLNSHSAKTGAKYYDNLGSARRSVLFNSLTKEEGGSKSTGEDVDQEHLAKRAKRDEETHEELVKKAKQDLDEAKKMTPLDLRPTGISDEDLIFLKQTFPDKVSRGI